MKIGIAGLGLIGGSLALVLRERHQITGFDISPETRVAAAAAGLRVVERLDGILPADAVIVATPIALVPPTLAELVARAPGAVLLDVASVRRPVEAFAREHGDAARMVGLHPMAGRSARGFGAADAALFAGRPFLVVPTARTDARAMAVAGEIARDAGGVVTVCSADEHDRIVALVSGLPLALAAALSAAAADGTFDLAALAGPGYRDATRLAGTPTDLAEALLLANASNVVAAIARFRSTLDDLERALAAGDTAALRGMLERAGSARAVLG